MLDQLIEILCEEKGEQAPTNLSETDKEQVFRSLCNVRPPLPCDKKFIRLQNSYLRKKTQERGVIDITTLNKTNNISLWQGDITRLNSNAIVNACNSALLGCFHPRHNCIDNVIHSYAGVQVRYDCNEIMQGAQLPTGDVRVTSAYNLPGKHIFHTVGPIIHSGEPTTQDQDNLASCYISSLNKATEMKLDSIAFCCISTGVYGYPQRDAAALAVSTVKNWLKENDNLHIIFNVFLDEDKEFYEQQLSS